VATALNELVDGSEWGILLQEESLPFSEPVRGLEELLGLDPLYSANEGKVLMVVSAANAEATLALLGDSAAVIGEVTEAHAGKVVLNTTMNTLRTIGVLTRFRGFVECLLIVNS